jgi:uncharacterized membrane protein AbrB (regulator of aidB expression)
MKFTLIGWLIGWLIGSIISIIIICILQIDNINFGLTVGGVFSLIGIYLGEILDNKAFEKDLK